MVKKYNYIYSQLVEDKTDIIGHIAYALYKAGKIDCIIQFKKEHGCEPTETDIETFNAISNSQNSIELNNTGLKDKEDACNSPS